MRSRGRSFVLMLLALALLLSLAKPQQARSESAKQNRAPKNSQQTAAPDERGADKSPLAVKLLSTGKSDAEAAQESEQIQTEYNSEWWVRILTAALVGVGLLQLFAYVVQARRLKETICVMHKTAERQLRAYLGVSLGGIVPQDRNQGFRFEPKMILRNAGQTPAYKVSYQAAAAVLPYPAPDDHSHFAFPNTPVPSSGMLIPNEQFVLSAVVPDWYSDEDVRDIRFGTTRRVYMWGRVTYVDAFGRKRQVEFSRNFEWLRNGNVMSYNTRLHNEAD